MSHFLARPKRSRIAPSSSGVGGIVPCGRYLLTGEMALHALAYNLTRVMNIIGVKPLIAAMAA